MNLIEIILYALLQGIFEFLPISSSGHLVLFSNILGNTSLPIWVIVAVHIGSLLAILFYTRKYIKKLFSKGDVQGLPTGSKGILFIVIATIPLIVVGAVFAKFITEIDTSNLTSLGVFAIINGLLLFAIAYFIKINKEEKTMSNIKAFVVGIFQSIAVIPGFSRSGFAIAGGVLQKVSTTQAIWFSFLIAIPAIFGAGAYLLFSELNNLPQFNLTHLIIAVVVSFISSLLSVHILLKLVQKIGFIPFGIYSVVLGAVILII